MVRGSCLCGAVAFEAAGDLPAPTACHCSQCRRQSGHYWASTDVPRDRVRITRDDGLAWFRSSAKVRRGFCKGCGSFLFWDAETQPTIAVSMGALDAPTGTRLSRHIFTADKGDYYEIGDDGLPRE